MFVQDIIELLRSLSVAGDTPGNYTDEQLLSYINLAYAELCDFCFDLTYAPYEIEDEVILPNNRSANLLADGATWYLAQEEAGLRNSELIREARGRWELGKRSLSSSQFNNDTTSLSMYESI